MNKYKNKKCEYDGIKFDSLLEMNFYVYLMELKEKGIVNEIELQPKFELQPSFLKNGKKVRAIEYKADFKVAYKNGLVEVIDVKGFLTKDFLLKKKMFDFNFPFMLKLVTFSKIDGGWIELEQLKINRRERKKGGNENVSIFL